MKFSKITFTTAGIYGLVTLVPCYFLEARIGMDSPPPISHPEYFYGFLGIALSWQLLFFAISTAPIRLRPVMPFALLEKLGFGGTAIVLYLG
jgi:hypothetical protein